jgi:protein-S-isoprenylcysteine O-methyltransferase Ste14
MSAMPAFRPTKLLPPLWFLLSLVAMGMLHRLAPVARLIPSPWNWLGVVPLLGGLVLAASGARLFARRGTGIKPFSPITTLVTTGPYRFTRNPMYLGLVLALVGVAVLLGTLTPWFVVPLFASWIHHRFIRQEEAMLEGQFGEEYAQFKRRVRRWV